MAQATLRSGRAPRPRHAPRAALRKTAAGAPPRSRTNDAVLTPLRVRTIDSRGGLGPWLSATDLENGSGPRGAGSVERSGSDGIAGDEPFAPCAGDLVLEAGPFDPRSGMPAGGERGGDPTRRYAPDPITAVCAIADALAVSPRHAGGALDSAAATIF